MSKTGSKGKKEKPREEEWIEMEDLKAPQNQNISKKLAQLEGKTYIPSPVIEEDLPYPPLSSLPSHQSSKQSSPQKVQTSNETHRQKTTPSLPLMEVTCDFCTVYQQVPGNTQLYSCGSCENMNECYPLFGVVVCGCCHSRFGFGFGVGEYVKCPKCVSVNRVPLEPRKEYRSVSILQSEGPRGARGREVESQKQAQQVYFQPQRRW